MHYTWKCMHEITYTGTFQKYTLFFGCHLGKPRFPFKSNLRSYIYINKFRELDSHHMTSCCKSPQSIESILDQAWFFYSSFWSSFLSICWILLNILFKNIIFKTKYIKILFILVKRQNECVKNVIPTCWNEFKIEMIWFW